MHLTTPSKKKKHTRQWHNTVSVVGNTAAAYLESDTKDVRNSVGSRPRERKALPLGCKQPYHLFPINRQVFMWDNMLCEVYGKQPKGSGRRPCHLMPRTIYHLKIHSWCVIRSRYYWVMRHQRNILPEPYIMSWLLPDSPSHKRWALQHFKIEMVHPWLAGAGSKGLHKLYQQVVQPQVIYPHCTGSSASDAPFVQGVP